MSEEYSFSLCRHGESIDGSGNDVYIVEILPAGDTICCHANQTVLSAMERAGAAKSLLGCRRGGCGICKVHIIEGEYESGCMSCAHVTPDEQANGIVLACRISPRSHIKLEIV